MQMGYVNTEMVALLIALIVKQESVDNVCQIIFWLLVLINVLNNHVKLIFVLNAVAFNVKNVPNLMRLIKIMEDVKLKSNIAQEIVKGA